MKKIINPWLGVEGYNCFGCCPSNIAGVKMEFYEDGEDIVSFWQPQKHYQSYINTLHGGIQATLIDEIAGWVVFQKLQTVGVTNRLNIIYKKSIGINEKIILRASLKEQKRNVAFIEIRIYNSQDELCTTAEAVYFCTSKEIAKQEMMFEGCKTEK